MTFAHENSWNLIQDVSSDIANYTLLHEQRKCFLRIEMLISIIINEKTKYTSYKRSGL